MEKIILTVPAGTKARWVSQSQAQGEKLSDWVREAVERPAHQTADYSRTWWPEILRAAEQMKPMPVETSLLGNVPYTIKGDQVVGEVPDCVIFAARAHGLEILPPDPKRNVYGFRKAW